jgi:hypothetical protein
MEVMERSEQEGKGLENQRSGARPIFYVRGMKISGRIVGVCSENFHPTLLSLVVSPVMISVRLSSRFAMNIPRQWSAASARPPIGSPLNQAQSKIGLRVPLRNNPRASPIFYLEEGWCGRVMRGRRKLPSMPREIF